MQDVRWRPDCRRAPRRPGAVLSAAYPQVTTDDDVQHLIDVDTHAVHAFKLYDPEPRTELALDKVILFRARDPHEQPGIWPELVERVALHQVDADHLSPVHHRHRADPGRAMARGWTSRLRFIMSLSTNCN